MKFRHLHKKADLDASDLVIAILGADKQSFYDKRHLPPEIRTALDAAEKKLAQAKADGATVPTGCRGQLLILMKLERKNDCPKESALFLGGKIFKSIRNAPAANAVVIANTAAAEEYASLIAQGMTLAAYSFDRHKKNKKPARVSGAAFYLRAAPSRAYTSDFELGLAVAQAQNRARDLVNEPGNVINPASFAAQARQVARSAGLKYEVFDRARLKREKFNMILTVGQGSVTPPRIVTMTYTPARKTKSGIRLALVGKGLTFDTGGISLKPGSGMGNMRCDMAGAAATLYAMQIVARIKPAFEVIGILGLAENMIGSRAARPLDVVVAKNGLSVQMDSTDAEGRLVLGDCVMLAGAKKATHIVDIATLTGEAAKVFGPAIAAVFGNDPDLVETIRKSGRDGCEHLWPMPLFEEYRKTIDGQIADLKNTGNGFAGAIVGGLFIREFVPANVKWAHLDIAGPMTISAARGCYSIGPTGFGVRTLVKLVEALG